MKRMPQNFKLTAFDHQGDRLYFTQTYLRAVVARWQTPSPGIKKVCHGARFHSLLRYKAGSALHSSGSLGQLPTYQWHEGTAFGALTTPGGTYADFAVNWGIRPGSTAARDDVRAWGAQVACRISHLVRGVLTFS